MYSATIHNALHNSNNMLQKVILSTEKDETFSVFIF